MCIACELGFFGMLEALPPEERERILREEAARMQPAAPFACEPVDAATPDAQAPAQERKDDIRRE
jgi:hypothetical protein